MRIVSDIKKEPKKPLCGIQSPHKTYTCELVKGHAGKHREGIFTWVTDMNGKKMVDWTDEKNK